MTMVDLLILGIILLSTLVSLVRGFVKEAMSLAGWVLALWIAMGFAGGFAEVFGKSIDDPTLRLLVSFITLFVFTLIVAAVANFFATQFVQRSGLTGIDRTIGLVFGFIRGIVLVTVSVMLAGLTQMPKSDWWDQSSLLFRFEVIASWLTALLPAEISRYFVY